MRLSKPIYLLILLLVGLRFFTFKPTAMFFDIAPVHTVLMFSWLIVGLTLWGDIRRIGRYKWMSALWILLLVGMSLSFIPLSFHHNQHPLYSLWLYRDFLVMYSIIPLILCMNFSQDDILRGTFLFSIVYAIALIFAFISPGLFVFLDHESASSDPEIVLPGVELLTVPLYMLLERHSKMPSYKYLVGILFIVLIIFVAQNRSTLFVAALFTVFSLWRGNSITVKILITSAVVLIFLNPNLNPLANLMNETQSQMTDDSYNRFLSWDYFLTNDFDSLEHIFFGRGVVSTHLGDDSDQMAMLAESGIFPSDVGFLGFIYYFGIIPVVVFILTSVIGIVKGIRLSASLAMLSFHVLVCGTTISFFMGYEHGLWFCMLFIMLCISTNSKKKGYFILKTTA